MIKLIFSIIFLIVCFLWASDTEVSFRPFSFAIPAWRYGLALVLVAAVLGLAKAEGHRKGYAEARDQVINIIREEKANQQK